MTVEPEDDGTRAFVDFEGLGVLSPAAFRLHGFAIVNSLKDGHPGFVSDKYLSAISAETTVTVLELEAAGIWERRTDGYLIIADDMLLRLVEHNELQGKQAAVCDARGTHVPGESDGSGRVLCADCGTPIARPESGQADPDQHSTLSTVAHQRPPPWLPRGVRSATLLHARRHPSRVPKIISTRALRVELANRPNQ